MTLIHRAVSVTVDRLIGDSNTYTTALTHDMLEMVDEKRIVYTVHPSKSKASAVVVVPVLFQK